MTVRLTPIFLALALVACGSPGSQTPMLASETGRVDRVVIAPLNLALRLPAELAGSEQAVWGELMQHFHAQDRVVRVVEPTDARGLWETVMSDPLARSDVRQASTLFARSLAEHADYDLLMMPALVMRRAHVLGGTAYWDGVRRRINVSDRLDGTLYSLSGGGEISAWGMRGQLAAASLYVSVLTPHGIHAYEGLGGLGLLHEADRDATGPRGTWRVVLRDDPLAATDELRKGIELALERKLPRTARAW